MAHRVPPVRSRRTAMNIAMTRCLVILALSASGAAHADAPDAALPAGQRVRVSAPGVSENALVGSVVASDERQLTIRVAQRTEPVTVPRSGITKLEVSDGRHSRGIGATIGAVSGALVGLAVGSRANWFTQQAEAGGAAIGALLGAGIGAAIPPAERWRSVNPGVRGARLVPRPDLGIGAGVVVGF
jgi:hypothetical protein